MTMRDAIVLVCKGLGLMYLVGSLQSLDFLAHNLGRTVMSGEGWEIWMLSASTLSVLIYLVAAALLLGKSRAISVLVLAEDRPLGISLESGWERTLLAVAVRVVGLVLVVEGLPDLVKPLPMVQLALRGGGTLPREVWGEILAAGVGIALGVHLLQGGKELLKLLGGRAMDLSSPEPTSKE